MLITRSITFYGKPGSKPWSITCHIGSHSVTCHPTEMNLPDFNPSQTGQYSIYLAPRNRRLSWPWYSYIKK